MDTNKTLDMRAQFAAAMAANAATDLGARDNPNAQNGAGEPNATEAMQLHAPGAKNAPGPFKSVLAQTAQNVPQAQQPAPPLPPQTHTQTDVVMQEGNPVDLAAQAAAFNAATATEANNARLTANLNALLAEAEPGRHKVRVLKAGARAPYMWAVTDHLYPVVATPTAPGLPSLVKMRLECDATRLRCMVQGLALRPLAAETVRKRGPKALPTVTPLDVQLFYKNLVGEMGTLAFLEDCLYRYLNQFYGPALQAMDEGLAQLANPSALPVYALHGGPTEYCWVQGGPVLHTATPKIILDSI